MKFRSTTHFDRAYAKAPKAIQDAFQKQLVLLLQTLRHPSLRAKKYDEGQRPLAGRVTKAWRFYFKIDDDTYIITRIVPHPKK